MEFIYKKVGVLWLSPSGVIFMKRILAVIIMTVSTTVFADKPVDCNPKANGHSQVACDQEIFNSVPLPGTLALIALGLTGLIISRSGRK
jgi:hypothetical protein